MVIEFVAIDENGVERDWIDPVKSVEETVTSFRVDNGCFVYDIQKQLGWQYIQREQEEGE